MEFRTERLFIRPVCIEDKESIFKYHSDSQTNKYLSLIPQSVEDVAEFINKNSIDINVPGTWFQLVIVERASKLLIGDIGIHFLENTNIEPDRFYKYIKIKTARVPEY